MIDHTGLQVASCAVSKAFYTRALAPLGYGIVVDSDTAAAFGPPDAPLFWIYSSDTPHTQVHIALRAPDRDSIDRFHAAALEAGATDHGAPGLRTDYHPNYYGAFVLDPDGNNIEAVCHDAP